jgi:hypothetical protein
MLHELYTKFSTPRDKFHILLLFPSQWMLENDEKPQIYLNYTWRDSSYCVLVLHSSHSVHGVLSTHRHVNLSDERNILFWELLSSAITSDCYVFTHHWTRDFIARHIIYNRIDYRRDPHLLVQHPHRWRSFSLSLFLALWLFLSCIGWMADVNDEIFPQGPKNTLWLETFFRCPARSNGRRLRSGDKNTVRDGSRLWFSAVI